MKRPESKETSEPPFGKRIGQVGSWIWGAWLGSMAENHFHGEIMQFPLQIVARKKADLFVFDMESLHLPTVLLLLSTSFVVRFFVAASLPERVLQKKTPIYRSKSYSVQLYPANIFFFATPPHGLLNRKCFFAHYIFGIVYYRLYIDCFFY